MSLKLTRKLAFHAPEDREPETPDDPAPPAPDENVEGKLTLHGIPSARALELLCAVQVQNEADLALCPRGTVDRLDVPPAEKVALLAGIALARLQVRLRDLDTSDTTCIEPP